MLPSTDLEIITVNYNTPDLIQDLIDSVRRHLGAIPIHVIDGTDKEMFERTFDTPGVKQTKIGFNIHHGPGLHWGMLESPCRYVLTLDSDAEVQSSQLLTYLFGCIPDDHFYACGLVRNIDTEGMNTGTDEGFRYIHPSCMLVNRSEYLKYDSFKKHGAPCAFPCVQLAMEGIADQMLISAPDIRQYVTTGTRGTVSRFGYNM